MIKIRCSFSGTAYICPPSVQADANEIRVMIGELPAAGQALHYILRMGIGEGQHVEISQAAAMFRVSDQDELDRLASQAWRAWEKVAEWFWDKHCEVYLQHQFGPILLSGHIDLVGMGPSDRMIRFLDWKSGWNEESHEDQMMAYACLLISNYQVDEVWGAIIRPRQGTADARIYTRAETEAWFEGLVRRFEESGNEYHAGKHCERCPRLIHCTAHTDYLRKESQVISLDGNFDGLQRGPKAWYERIRMLEKSCALARDVLKSEIAARGGTWEDLQLVEESRETVRYSVESVAILIQHGFKAEDFERIAKLSKTEIKKISMEKAGPLLKGKTAQALLDRLRDAGTIETTYFNTIAIRKDHERANRSTETPPAISNLRDGESIPDSA